MLKVAINGFGRIGRSAFKIALDKFQDQLEIVAVNDLGDAKTLAHLLKYDSNYGIWERDVGSDEKHIIVDQKPYLVLQEKEPQNLPWKDLGVDVVVESTGRFTKGEDAKKHIQAGAKRVVISAPVHSTSKESKATFEVSTYLLGVNAQQYSGEEVISNSSCTTNCIAPVAKVIHEKFGIVKAMMTTTHAYTQDQNLQDGPHKDLRRARAAAQNIVPTSTGAAISTTHVIPELEGKFDGVAIRVPVAVGSISDFTFLLSKKVTVEEVNQALTEAAKGEMKDIMAVTSDPIVSSDIVGRPESAIVDLGLTQVVDGDMVKVFAWYDNEYGYSCRLVEQVINVGKSIS